MKRTVRVISALVFLMVLGGGIAASLGAQAVEQNDQRAVTEDVDPWFFRAEAGSAQIHNWDDRELWLALRVGRSLGTSGLFRLGAGLTYSGSGEGFVTFELDLEVLPLPAYVVTPVLGAGLGLLTESEWGGPVFDAWGGLSVRISRMLALRAVYQYGVHGGEEGPEGFLLGFEVSARPPG